MLGHRISTEVIVAPGFVRVSGDDIPADVRINTEGAIVPGFVWVRYHYIPGNVAY